MKNVKIGIIVGALAAALLITIFFGGEEKIPDDGSTNTHWQCIACGHSYDLSLTELLKEYQRVGTENAPLICPKCSEKKVYQPVACHVCKTIFFGTEVPDSTGECPKCKPDATPPPYIEEERRRQEQVEPDPEAPPEKPQPRQV